MTKRKREPRPPKPTPNLPATFAEAEIIDAMTDWPDRMDAALRGAGLGEDLNDREAGHRLWQAKFEYELTTSKDPDTLATITYLAEQGHIAAQRTLRDHATKLLEDGKADLPSSVRTYLIRLINGLVPAHPEDKSEVIDHLFRDLGIVVMVDTAGARWSLPKLNSSQSRKSAAYYVALIMTRRGVKLGEQPLRRRRKPQKWRKMADLKERKRRRRWRGPALGGRLQRGVRFCFTAHDGEAATPSSVRAFLCPGGCQGMQGGLEG